MKLVCSDCYFVFEKDSPGQKPPVHYKATDVAVMDESCPGESSICAACGGEGSFEEDNFDHRHGHYTKSTPCSECISDTDYRELDA